MKQRWVDWYHRFLALYPVRLMLRAGTRFNRDLCFTRAASLSYTSLVSLVPAVTLGALFFTTFHFGTELSHDLENFLLKHTLPESTQLIKKYLDQFSANTTAVNIVGFISLIVTALLLINSVEQNLNDIWRSHEQRPILKKIAFFWSFLTLTPLCLGFSIYYTARMEQMEMLNEVVNISKLTQFFAPTIPVFFAAVAFFTLFYLIPYSPAPAQACLVGSVVAAILWEIAKRMFDNYLVNVVYYNIIYGSIGIIPIFLIWLYFTWLIILFGAQITIVYQLPDEESVSENEYAGFYLLSILNLIALSYEKGTGTVKFEEIQSALNLSPAATMGFLSRLVECDLVTEGRNQAYLLNNSPDSMNLWDIFGRLKINYFDIPSSFPLRDDNDFIRHLLELQKNLKEQFHRQLSKVSLKSLQKRPFRVISGSYLAMANLVPND